MLLARYRVLIGLLTFSVSTEQVLVARAQESAAPRRADSLCADLDAIYAPLRAAGRDIVTVRARFKRMNRSNTSGAVGLMNNFSAMATECSERSERTTAALGNVEKHAYLKAEAELRSEVKKAYQFVANSDQQFASLFGDSRSDVNEILVKIMRLGELLEPQMEKLIGEFQSDHTRRCAEMSKLSAAQAKSETSAAQATSQPKPIWVSRTNLTKAPASGAVILKEVRVSPSFADFSSNAQVIAAIHAVHPSFNDLNLLGTYGDPLVARLPGGRNFVVVEGCMPKACVGTWYAIAYEVATGRAAVLQEQPQRKGDQGYLFYGGPDSSVTSLLVENAVQRNSEDSALQQRVLTSTVRQAPTEAATAVDTNSDSGEHPSEELISSLESGFVLAGDKLAFLDQGGLRALPTSGGSPKLVARISGATALTTEGSTIYVAASGRAQAKQSASIVAISDDGKQTTLVKSLPGPLSSLWVGAEKLAWVTNDNKGKSTIGACDRQACKPIVLARDLADVRQFQADDTHVYWIAKEKVFSIAKAGGEPTLLAQVPRSRLPGAVLVGIAVDDAYVYFAGEESIQRVPKTGGQVQNIAMQVASAGQIAVDEKYVYWVEVGGDRVAKAPKSGGPPMNLNPLGFEGMTFALDLSQDAKHIYVWLSMQMGNDESRTLFRVRK